MHARAKGFTYLGLIILVAIIGLVGAAGLKVGSLLQRAHAEEELLAIGAEFSDALRSYAAVTPKGQPQQPPSLQELLKDPRFPNIRRHLRKIFVDPVTGRQEWGIVYLGDKVGVVGVYSLSQAPPLKIANFDARFINFENKEHLSDWKFTMSGQGAVAPPALTPPLVAPLVPPAVRPVVPPAVTPAVTPDTAPEPEGEPEPAPPAAEPAPEPAPPAEPPADETPEKETPPDPKKY